MFGQEGMTFSHDMRNDRPGVVNFKIGDLGMSVTWSKENALEALEVLEEINNLKEGERLPYNLSHTFMTVRGMQSDEELAKIIKKQLGIKEKPKQPKGYKQEPQMRSRIGGNEFAQMMNEIKRNAVNKVKRKPKKVKRK